jgi:hypothetical protein
MKFLKRGQLVMIEFQYFMVGLGIGLVAGLTLVALSARKILPFEIPLVCGSTLLTGFLPKNKKGQLAMIEFHFLLAGLVIGIIGSAALVYLGNTSIIPFKIPFVCG